MRPEERIEVTLKILKLLKEGRYYKQKDACMACGIDPTSFPSLKNSVKKYIEKNNIDLDENDRKLLYSEKKCPPKKTSMISHTCPQ